MNTLQNFGLPAFQNDFQNDPSKAQQLTELWTTNVCGWINQGIVGNPWNVVGSSNQTFFYNPLYTNIPSTAEAVQVTWNAFPNRLKQYLQEGQVPANPYGFSDTQILQLADTGYYQTPQTPDNSFKTIPTKLCPVVDWSTLSSSSQVYGPYGPRGWLDEYCEWSVTYDENHNITRVDFVCENPEYWYTLWKVDPEKVRELYEQTLNYNMPVNQQISVAIADLQLIDPATQKPIIDPETGRPAYNPLNKWNSGPISVRTGDSSQFSGGAMHLTSTPNTLQTELGLAGAATVQRTVGNNDPQKLICCSQYGQNYRNSDPTIGQAVNGVVQGQGTPNIACLANPVGLYIQVPDFTNYHIPQQIKLPAGSSVADCWQIVRGQISLVDPVTNQPFTGSYPDPNNPNLQVGNFILHAVFQIPQAWQDLNPQGLTLSDIQIHDQPIQWAGQIAKTFDIALYARPISVAHAAPPLPCVSTPNSPANQPLQLMYTSLWDAYYQTIEPNPTNQTLPLVSNTTYVVAGAAQGQSSVQLALTYSPASTSPPIPLVEFSTVNNANPIGNQNVDSQITAKVLKNPMPVSYAVPGNSYPSQSYVLFLELNVSASAELGLRGVRITDPGQTPAPFAPALLNIITSGT